MVGALKIKEAARRGRDSSHFTAFSNASALDRARTTFTIRKWSNNVARTTMKVHPKSTREFLYQG